MVIGKPFSPKRATSPMRSPAWPAAMPLAMAELAPHVRSALFAPGTDAARLRKAVTVGADACIFDLEDAVPLQRAAEARPTLSHALHESDPPGAGSGPGQSSPRPPTPRGPASPALRRRGAAVAPKSRGCPDGA